MKKYEDHPWSCYDLIEIEKRLPLSDRTNNILAEFKHSIYPFSTDLEEAIEFYNMIKEFCESKVEKLQQPNASESQAEYK